MGHAAIVGGGPAGLVTAIALRRIGWQATVIDAARPPIDKACGEGLLPLGVRALYDLGIDVTTLPHAAIAGIRFVNGEQAVEAELLRGHGLGIRRTDLHATLVQAAQNAGVTLVWGQPVLGIRRNAVLLRNRSLFADLIVGADGTNSRVRKWAGLDREFSHGFRQGSSSYRYGFRQHFALSPLQRWTDKVEVYWCKDAQVYVTPISPTRIGVAWMSSSPHATLERMLQQLPELAAHLSGAKPCTPRRGAISRSQRLNRVVGGTVALVGEASGSVDAITGEGLTLAFRQAAALAECVRRGDFASYETQHVRIMRQTRMMSSVLLALGHRPNLRARTMRALAAQPEVFSQLLNMHAQAKAADVGHLSVWIRAAFAFAFGPKKFGLSRIEPSRIQTRKFT